MSADTRNVHEVTTRTGNTIERTTEVSSDDTSHRAAHEQNVATRVVWFIAGVLEVILGLRFILSLLGANPSNAFANFIYSVSHPFVSPFFSLFSYNFTNGVAHFELYTLFAMLIYGLISWGIAYLVAINRD